MSPGIGRHLRAGQIPEQSEHGFADRARYLIQECLASGRHCKVPETVSEINARDERSTTGDFPDDTTVQSLASTSGPRQ